MPDTLPVVAYLDTNALVKLYLPEPQGSGRVQALIEATDGVATSAITYPEARGVFARVLARTQLSTQEHDERLSAFESDWLTLTVVDLTERVYRRAGDLMAAHPTLRGMDAIQLSSALEAREDAGIRFLSFDTDLQHVAEAMLHRSEIG